MATGISVTRSVLAALEGTDLIAAIANRLTEEVDKTKNPFFGRAPLGDLKARLIQTIITHIAELVVKQRGEVK
jgi:hypothetical protein